MVELKYEWWEYFVIPWFAGVVGYVTNVLALEMMFRPLEFWGIPLFRLKGEPWGILGWQGVVPTRAEKMASVCFDLMTSKLINVKEVFSRLDPNQFSIEMEDGVLLLMDETINEVANELAPSIWEKVPQEVKDDIIVMADEECTTFMNNFMKDMQDNVDKIVDLKELSVRSCVEKKELVIKIFREVGDKEFEFIRRSGFYFGFLFGCVQMTIWFFYNGSWLLPVAAFLVGWVTNVLALKVIFRPLEPTKVCGFTLQGIFLRRQEEVSESFARIVCVDIIHIKAIWDEIFTGPLSQNFYALMRAHTIVFTEKLLSEVKPVLVAAMGASQFADLKEEIAQKVVEKMPSIIDHSYEYTQKALNLEETMRTKMAALSSEEFEGVLHPCFEEDEILLIAVGGLLGLSVGIIQLFTIFA
mmetsp:Transcript_22160/g.34081  ORF Transcript_22160/g.34081 Transcript_22160/m.34081 type:complete len:413 (-) Transcript_22160:1240-2478(-)